MKLVNNDFQDSCRDLVQGDWFYGRALFEMLQEVLHGPSLIVGGTLRNIALDLGPAKDLDIAYTKLNRKKLDYVLSTLNGEFVGNTYLGGIKVRIAGVTIELFNIQEIKAFEEDWYEYNHPSDYVKIVPLNVEAIAYDFVNNELYENGFFDAINSMTLKFNFKKFSVSDNSIRSRIKKLRDIFGFRLDKEVKEFVNNGD